MPAAGSLLRFPDTHILSFAPEAVDSRSFVFRSWHPMPQAWIPPEKVRTEPDLPPPDFSITTDLPAVTVFGPAPEVKFPSPPALLDPAPFPIDSGPSDFLFLLTGLATFSVPLLMRVPRNRRTLAEPVRFSSQLPQIIHLTRPGGLP